MKRNLLMATLLASTMLASAAFAGQAPGAASDADVPISHRDRIYAAEQFSNTVSVSDPIDNKLLGVIRCVSAWNKGSDSHLMILSAEFAVLQRGNQPCESVFESRRLCRVGWLSRA
jgi:hypothetical protein